MKTKRKEISSPVDFKHCMHVGFDPDSGSFTGLPDGWAQLLHNSNIPINDIKECPDTVIAVSNLKN
jgi:hypothetical protein